MRRLFAWKPRNRFCPKLTFLIMKNWGLSFWNVTLKIGMTHACVSFDNVTRCAFHNRSVYSEEKPNILAFKRTIPERTSTGLLRGDEKHWVSSTDIDKTMDTLMNSKIGKTVIWPGGNAYDYKKEDSNVKCLFCHFSLSLSISICVFFFFTFFLKSIFLYSHDCLRKKIH